MNSPTDLHDDESRWLAALRQGDAAAFRLLFDRHYPLLLADAYRLFPDEDTCKDLAQEVFVELWRKRESLDIRISLRAYLRRAVVNRTLNFIKSSRRFVLEEAEAEAPIADTSPADIRHKQEQENLDAALQAALETLPEKCRLVFSLSRFEQQSHREISESLGISMKTIENQITKALRVLREALAQYAHLSPVVIFLLKVWGGHRG